MKKYLLATFGVGVLLALSACGNGEENSPASESSNITETTVGETTVAETTAATTTLTKPVTTTVKVTTKQPDKHEYSLEETQNVGDLSFKLPKNCKVKTQDINSGKMNTIVFPDLSIIQVADIPVPYDIDDLSDSELTLVLNTYAESFISNEAWKKISDPKEIDIDEHITIKQDAELLKQGESTLYHFAYNGHIYSFAFIKVSSLDNATASYDLQNKIINSLEFKEVKADKKEVETDKEETPVVPDSNETLGQKNALKTAKSYIDYSAFSYLSLIKQLEYEGYSNEEAVYGADNCGADWNAEALESAESYISYSDFSYQGLLEQLEYEQFTNEQAVYGADNCGADWFQEAADCAESYISYSSFSSKELLDQLLYEGFTQDQAEYGLQSVGY